MMEHNVHGKLTGAGGDGGCVLGFYMPTSNDGEYADIPKLKEILNG